MTNYNSKWNKPQNNQEEKSLDIFQSSNDSDGVEELAVMESEDQPQTVEIHESVVITTTVGIDKLNVRETPGGNIVGVVNRDTEIKYFEDDSKTVDGERWVYAQAHGGWVMAKFLYPSSNA